IGETQQPEPTTASGEDEEQTPAPADAGKKPTKRDAAAPTPEPVLDGGVRSPDGGETPADDAGPSSKSCEARCSAAGGKCIEGEQPTADRCVFECADGECEAAITCPGDLDCEVTCTGDSCKGLVTCPERGDCSVTCDGKSCA